MLETVNEPRAVGDVLDCGDVLTAEMRGAAGIGAGYAYTADGRTLCYRHADEAERADMAASDKFLGFVSDAGDLTTWSGGVLARGVPRSGGVSRSGWHGSRVYSWRFRAPDGSEWYGRNGGPGAVILVRRAKA